VSGGEGRTGQDARLTAKATHSSTSGLHLHIHLHHHHNNCRRNSKPACHNSALPVFTGSACTELSTGSTPYQYNSPLAMQPSFPLGPLSLSLSLSLSLPLLSLLRPKVITFSSHLNHPIPSHLISSHLKRQTTSVHLHPFHPSNRKKYLTSDLSTFHSHLELRKRGGPGFGCKRQQTIIQVPVFLVVACRLSLLAQSICGLSEQLLTTLSIPSKAKRKSCAPPLPFSLPFSHLLPHAPALSLS